MSDARPGSAPSTTTRIAAAPLLAALLLVLLLTVIVAAGRGAYPIDSLTVLSVLLDTLHIPAGPHTSEQAAVLWSIRLPRVLLGVCVGAALGMAGAAMQSLFRNPLADPGLIGVTSGAMLAVALAIVFGNAMVSTESQLGEWITLGLLPAAAFAGAAASAALIWRIGRSVCGASVAAMLLGGIALNALALALIGLASYLATDEQLRNLTFWSLGSLGQARWPGVAIVAAGSLVALALLWSLRAGLNALALGEIPARHLGVPVEKLKRIAILGVAIAVGVSVAFCGMIGFIGLVAPHCVRLLAGPDARVVLPGAALLGAVLVVAADLVARTLAAPAEIPIGVLTALIGAPFFMVLLLRARSRLVPT